MRWGPFAVFVVMFLAGVDACSMPVGWRPLAVEEQMLNAQQVLYAIVRRTFPDDTGMQWRENLYTAEVEVFCIMKGQQTPRIVNITDVGLLQNWTWVRSIHGSGQIGLGGSGPDFFLT